MGVSVVRPMPAATAAGQSAQERALVPWDDVEEDAVDEDVSATIHRLMEQEHQLRAQESRTGVGAPEELATLEVELDRCWDLLRQRRALRESGQDASTAAARPEQVVERYLQ